MTADEVRRRAVSGSALIALRGIATRVFGLLSSVVVARLLLPEQVGMVAFGATVMVAGAFFADGGLAAGLLRRAAPPTQPELQAILGLQLTITTAVAVIITLCSLPYGTIGAVTAVMVAALPATAFRTPAIVLLERQLNYRPIAVVEVVESVIFLLWAMCTITAGFGVYGLATAWLARSVIGSCLLFRSVSGSRIRPSWDVGLVKPVLGFGMRFQAVTLVNLLRDQGLNVLIAVVAGVQVLGLWSLAYRLMQVPYLLFGALWRVSYPALARLLELGEDPRDLLARGLRLTAVGTGLLLVPFVTAAPGLVPVIFGEEWQPIVPVIVISATGLLVAGPISVASAGYLYAVGDARRVLVSATFHTIAWLGVAIPLLPSIGVAAVGIGWAASGAVESVVMVMSVRRWTPVPVLRMCWRPWLMAVLAVVVVASLPIVRRPGIGYGVGGGTTALAVFVIGLMALHEPAIAQLYGLARRAVPGRRPGPARG